MGDLEPDDLHSYDGINCHCALASAYMIKLRMSFIAVVAIIVSLLKLVVTDNS